MPLTDSFRGDIEFLYEKLKKKEPFTFSKYADGEYKILRNQKITNCDHWTFDPEKHIAQQRLIYNSFIYKHPDYYVGISCPCCQPKDHVQWMRSNVGTEKVTWANLFVNSNYNFFKETFFEEFNNWDAPVTIVANKKGIDKELPFKRDYYYPIEIGEWLDNFKLTKALFNLNYQSMNGNGRLFLFSAGPLGNILAFFMHRINPNNTYIDIGSTINPWIVGKNRRYLKGNNNKTCIW